MPKAYAEISSLLPNFRDCLDHDKPESVVLAVKAKGRLVSFLHDTTHASWKTNERIQLLIKATLAELNQNPPRGKEFTQFQTLKHAFRNEYEANKADLIMRGRQAEIEAEARRAAEREAQRQAELRRQEEERRAREEAERRDAAQRQAQLEAARRLQEANAQIHRIALQRLHPPLPPAHINLPRNFPHVQPVAMPRVPVVPVHAGIQNNSNMLPDQEYQTILGEAREHLYNPRAHRRLWTSGRLDIIKNLLSLGIEPPNEAGSSILRSIEVSGEHDFARDFARMQAANTARTENGQTIFHIACQNGWEDIIRICLAKNPMPGAFYKKDNSGRTAIGCLFESPQWLVGSPSMQRIARDLFGASLPFQPAFFKNLPAFRQWCEWCAANPHLLLRGRPFEHAFLLGSETIGKNVCPLITRQNFEDQFQHMEQFPRDDVAAFHDNILYSRVAAPQNQGGLAASGIIPEPPSDIQLMSLKDLFAKINFTNPQEPNYYNPCHRFEYSQTNNPPDAIAEANRALDTLLNNITHNALSGLEGTSIKYEEMRRRLLHILALLSKLELEQNADHSIDSEVIKKNQSLLLETMSQFVNAGTHCAPRVYNTLVEQYEKVVEGRATFAASVSQELADLRRLFLQGLLPPHNNESILLWTAVVNGFNQLFPHLALPEGEALQDLHDRFSNQQAFLDIADLGHKVEAAYTPAAILDRLSSHLEESEPFRDQFRDFYVENVLTQCASQKFGSNWAAQTPAWATQNLPHNWAEAIPSSYHPELPAEQRTQSYRQKLFLESEFEDHLLDLATGKMKREALACALQYLGILEESQFLS